VLEGVFRGTEPTRLVAHYGLAQVQLALDVVNFMAYQGKRIASPEGLLVAMLRRGEILPPRGFVPREKRMPRALAVPQPAADASTVPSATHPPSLSSDPSDFAPYTAEELRRQAADRARTAAIEAERALVEARRAALSPETLRALEVQAQANVLAERARKKLPGAPPAYLLELSVRLEVNRLLRESATSATGEVAAEACA
jgi:hypothetical protein